MDKERKKKVGSWASMLPSTTQNGSPLVAADDVAEVMKFLADDGLQKLAEKWRKLFPEQSAEIAASMPTWENNLYKMGEAAIISRYEYPQLWRGYLSEILYADSSFAPFVESITEVVNAVKGNQEEKKFVAALKEFWKSAKISEGMAGNITD